jgi:hypothetical protein
MPIVRGITVDIESIIALLTRPPLLRNKDFGGKFNRVSVAASRHGPSMTRRESRITSPI